MSDFLRLDLLVFRRSCAVHYKHTLGFDVSFVQNVSNLLEMDLLWSLFVEFGLGEMKVGLRWIDREG